jgi:hypothetical protein
VVSVGPLGVVEKDGQVSERGAQTYCPLVNWQAAIAAETAPAAAVRTGSVKLGKKCVVNRAVSWLVVYNTVQGRRYSGGGGKRVMSWLVVYDTVQGRRYSRGWRRRRNRVMSWLVVQEIQG